jgi:hypothetical protein
MKEARKHRCTAKTSSGRPRKRWAMNAQEVCATHGGRSPQAAASC